MTDRAYIKGELTKSIGTYVDMASETELEAMSGLVELLVRKAVFARGADRAAPDMAHRLRFYREFIVEYELSVCDKLDRLDQDYAQLRKAEGMNC